jgi:hypothetical protein
MDPEGYQQLVQSMRDGYLPGHGKIELLDGKIIDGRNRYEAWHEAGGNGDIMQHTEEIMLPEDEVRAYVWKKNSVRRHLGALQKALIWLCGRTESRDSTRAIAEGAGVSQKTIVRATHILDNAGDDVAQAVIDGTIEPKEAAELADAERANKQKVHGKAQKDKDFVYDLVRRCEPGVKYTKQTLSALPGLQSYAHWFLRACEVAPNIIVHRSDGGKQGDSYEFEFYLDDEFGAIRELANRIVERAAHDHDVEDAKQIISLIGEQA